MNTQERIALLKQLKMYLVSNSEELMAVKHKAYLSNPWFIPEFVDLSINNIIHQYLDEEQLSAFISKYINHGNRVASKTVGIVMAGNIPLVGFHDFLCVFLSGHNQKIKTSSKDDVLISHCIDKLTEWNPDVAHSVYIAENLKHCDAYIATGSSNSARYFEYYFGRYPSIIRRNKTSVAILDGTETLEELELLGDDMLQYFGLGCRNVTKLYLPLNFKFEQLIQAIIKYDYLNEHNKFRNNYDYQLALHILNNKYYMTSKALLLVEREPVFAPVSQVHYSFYDEPELLENSLKDNADIQAIVSKNHIPFGEAQRPLLNQFADGVDTMQFLINL